MLELMLGTQEIQVHGTFESQRTYSYLLKDFSVDSDVCLAMAKLNIE